MQLGFIVAFFLCSFLSNDKDAQKIIDKAIEAHGGNAYENLSLAFTFREKEYTITLDKGAFTYTRSFTDKLGEYRDVLNNDGFTRHLNGEVQSLSDEEAGKYTNSVNSVVYFTLLPRGLNDAAVKKQKLGINKINGQKYHVIKISFEEEGGGVDHEDEFIYWVNYNSYTIDFLAYSFHVNDGGVRFREAINPTEIGGVRFQNYINYRPSEKKTALENLPFLFVEKELIKLSEIVNENYSLLK